MRRDFFIFLAILFSVGVLAQKPNPPMMGWASWNNYRVNISDSIIKRQADFLVSTGLKKAGYKYINIDDGFFAGRDIKGNLRINKQRFPNGMKSVADYIHSKGLKAGIYSEIGANTCASIWDNELGGVGAGLYKNEEKDLRLFINDWGYDYIKVDYCGASQQDLKLDEKSYYSAVRNILDKITDKKVDFNVCRWQFPGTWVTNIADSWRVSADIANEFKSMLHIIDVNTFLAPYMRPGHYNDMDMLQIGRGMTPDQDKAQMSMWAVLTSPLVLGNDLSAISPQTLEIVSNPEVIAVNQDITEQGHLISEYKNPLQIWAKKLNGKNSGEVAVVLFNRTNKPENINLEFKDIGLKQTVSIRDLWKKKDLGVYKNSFSTNVPANGVVMLKIKGDYTPPKVYEAEYAYLNNYNLTQNTQVLKGQAKPIFNANASKKAMVTNIGNNLENYIEFREVFAPEKGCYTVKIYYFSKVKTNAVVYVNGVKDKTIKFKKAPKGRVKSIKVELNKGLNTIKLNNPNAFIPDLDKIEVVF